MRQPLGGVAIHHWLSADHTKHKRHGPMNIPKQLPRGLQSQPPRTAPTGSRHRLGRPPIASAPNHKTKHQVLQLTRQSHDCGDASGTQQRTADAVAIRDCCKFVSVSLEDRHLKFRCVVVPTLCARTPSQQYLPAPRAVEGMENEWQAGEGGRCRCVSCRREGPRLLSGIAPWPSRFCRGFFFLCCVWDPTAPSSPAATAPSSPPHPPSQARWCHHYLIYISIHCAAGHGLLALSGQAQQCCGGGALQARGGCGGI